MQRIELTDKNGVLHYWERNDDEANLWVEEILATNKYGFPDEVSVTMTEFAPGEGGGRTEETFIAGETIPANQAVAIRRAGTGADVKVYALQPVMDDIYNDFDSRLLESCKCGGENIAIAYTEPSTGHLYVREGFKSGTRVEWHGLPVNVGEDQPSSFSVCAFGEASFILIAQYGEMLAGHAWVCSISEEGITLGPPTMFSTEAKATDMSCIDIDGWAHFAVAYRDGGDTKGYTKIGQVEEGTNIITWIHTWNHGITETFENKLCPLGWGEEGTTLFAVVYRRAGSEPYKLYTQLATINTEEVSFSVVSAETIVAATFGKDISVASNYGEEGHKNLIVAYVDVEMAGQGVVRIGDCTDWTNPQFNDAWKLVVCATNTGSIHVDSIHATMAQTFYMTWINHAQGSRFEFNMYYFENNMPMSNTGEIVADYWPTVNNTLVAFSYQGVIDLWTAFTYVNDQNEHKTWNRATTNFWLAIEFAQGVTAEAKNQGEEIKVNIEGQVNPRPSPQVGYSEYIQRNKDINERVSPFPIGYIINENEMLVTKTPRQ